MVKRLPPTPVLSIPGMDNASEVLDCAHNRIVHAFREAIFEQPFEQLRVSTLVRDAKVARSTFYQLFPNLHAVLLASIGPLLDLTIRCLHGTANRDEARALAQHLWDNRALARVLFHGTTLSLLTRALAERLAPHEQTNEPATSIRNTFTASGVLGVVLAWVEGRLLTDVDGMVDWLLSAADGPQTLQPGILAAQVLPFQKPDQRPDACSPGHDATVILEPGRHTQQRRS